MKLNQAILAAVLTLVSVHAYADNTLSISRKGPTIVELNLENTNDVAAIQFSFRSSYNIKLSNFERGERVSDAAWTVASYQPNDSTINVVILGSARQFLTNGSGSLARITIQMASTGNEVPGQISLTRVLMASCRAESLAVTVQNLEWGVSKYFERTLSSSSFKLGQNFPNPFNPSTSLAYSLTKPGQVRLSVYDVTGREISRLVDSYQFVGTYSIRWNSNDTPGGTLPSGVYFARLQVDGDAQTSKMILAK